MGLHHKRLSYRTACTSISLLSFCAVRRGGGWLGNCNFETFAKKYFPGVDPLRQRLLVEQLIPGVTRLGPYIEWLIVGVYHNVHNGGPKDEGFPEIDVPFWQSPWPSACIAVRASINPATLSKEISDIVLSMNSNLPLAEVKTMDQIKDESVAGDRFTAFLFGGFAGVALLLSALGIYGVMSFAVAQKTQEIGLRMALGAGQSRVLALILREGMILAAIGLLLGLGGAYFVGRVMPSLFADVGVIDVKALSAVTAILLASALTACYVPALPAAKVDPMQAPREDEHDSVSYRAASILAKRACQVDPQGSRARDSTGDCRDGEQENRSPAEGDRVNRRNAEQQPCC